MPLILPTAGATSWSFVNAKLTTVVASLVAAVIISLDVFPLQQTFFG